MGMNVRPNTGKHSTPTTLAEINVTPLVDVMLVLLIIFMISAPLMQQGVSVDLPKATAGNLTETPDQVELIIDKNRQILIGTEKLSLEEVTVKLKAIAAVKPGIQVNIRADQSIPYGAVAEVMAGVKQAQIHRVGLVTEPIQKR
jgi:biopolymer transport protein TolR